MDKIYSMYVFMYTYIYTNTHTHTRIHSPTSISETYRTHYHSTVNIKVQTCACIH